MTRNLHFKLPAALYDALTEQAARENRPLADVVRTALADYLQARGHEIVVTVERGGARRGAGRKVSMP